jgi:uncharacterized protein (TIGR00730 family)
MTLNIPSGVGQRINRELELAKAVLESLTPAVSIYGGARVTPDDPYYEKTLTLARALSAAGVSVISGGGPGIMEAANRGAQEGMLGLSIGLNINLPCEQKANPYQDLCIDFEHFSSRKVAFCKYSMAFVAMPGGFGTLDELFEVVTLIQTGKMPNIPVLLYGGEFWNGLLDWLRGMVLPRGLISAQDVDERLCVVDTVEEVLALVLPRIPRRTLAA